MHGTSLYEYYEKFLLPQFGLIDRKIDWLNSEAVGPDENVHYFNVDSKNYALVFEDYGGLANSSEWVKENVKLKGTSFEYIKPTSNSNGSVSYTVSFPVPYHYCENVTGSFMLIRI